MTGTGERGQREMPYRFLPTLVLLALVGCSSKDEDALKLDELLGQDDILGLGTKPFTGDLPAMRKRKLIRALVPYSLTEFFISDGVPRGIQAELLQAYEAHLNVGVDKPGERVRIRFVPVPYTGLIQALREGRGDIAAAMLTMTRERKSNVAFASGRALEVDELIVTHSSVKDIATIEDLAGHELMVMAGGNHETHLRAFNKTLVASGRPPITILRADPFMNNGDILQMVNAGVVPITLADDYLARLWTQVLPDLRVREDLIVTRGAHVGWAVRPGNPVLLADLERFFQRNKKGSLIYNVLFQRYFESTHWIGNPTLREERDKLGKLLSLFEKYGARYDFEALALAAQAYQESRLDQSRRSPAGAIGIMQILPSTAADPNVDIPHIQRLDANIHAGAKYLHFLRARYFSEPRISPADQLALSWAAYNAGPAKVRQMRELARKMGLNPNVWFENVETAAARIVGSETVDYVANIHKYYLAYKLSTHLLNQKQESASQGGG